MADYSNKVPLQHPANTQSENGPAGITSATDAKPVNPHHETDNMEVHHHAHDPATHHHKKN